MLAANKPQPTPNNAIQTRAVPNTAKAVISTHRNVNTESPEGYVDNGTHFYRLPKMIITNSKSRNSNENHKGSSKNHK
jgi:hypothetical protein